jgi:drug/metabolite transporter (DMT)-like permease
MIFDFMGLLYVSAQLERLALFTYPVFVMLLGAVFLGQRLTLGNILPALLAYLGLTIIFLSDLSATGSAIWLGTGLVLASALAFAIYQLWAKELITVMGSLLFTSIALTSASITSIAHFFIARGVPPIESSSFMALAFATAVIATVIPSYLVNAGMSRIGAQSTAMISTISPLFTIGLAVMLLNEKFQLREAFGTALVVGGIGSHTLRDLRGTRTPSP